MSVGATDARASGNQAVEADSFERVVLLTRFYPYPEHAGAFLYGAQMITLWSRLAGHLDVFCVIQPGTSPDLSVAHTMRGVTFHFGHAKRSGLLQLLLGREPKSAQEFANASNAEMVRKLLHDKRPDVIVVDHLGATWALPLIRQYRRSRSQPPRVVYTSHNEETSTRLSIAREAGILRGLFFRADAVRIRRREREMLSEADYLTCICESDRRAYKAMAALPSIVIEPTYAGPVVDERVIAPSCPRKVVIVSSFYWSAKVLNLARFLRQCLSRLQECGIAVEVVGRMRPATLQRLQAQYPRVVFHGEVAEVEPYLKDARFGLLIDSAGGGFKLTVLTYAFNRLPIAALDSAISDDRWRKHMLVDADFDALTTAILRTIDKPDRLNAMQYGMFEYMKSYLDIGRNVDRLRRFVEPSSSLPPRRHCGEFEQS